MSDSLWPHESQHARPPCPSPTPGLHSDSRPSSPWCHPAISSSVDPFSSCPQSLPASESFPMSQLFAWGGQRAGKGGSAVKNPPAIQELQETWVWSLGLIPGLGRSPRGGHGNPLHYSCLENPMDRGAWRARVYRVAKSWTWQGTEQQQPNDFEKSYALFYLFIILFTFIYKCVCVFVHSVESDSLWPQGL